MAAEKNVFSLFGWEIKRPNEDNVSFAAKPNEDGGVVIEGSGVYGTYLDMDGSVRTEAELVNKYREMAEHPEIDMAVDDIVNEVITQDPDAKPVEVILDDLDQPDRIKKLIIKEFDNTLNLLDFDKLSYEIVRRWYVDGRVYYHAIIDEDDPSRGVLELRYIDPRKISKVTTVQRKRSLGSHGVTMSGKETEFFIYSEKGFAKTSGSMSTPTTNDGGIKIAKDSIVHCTSGITSVTGDLVKSYLHKAIKPLNQLRSMEDSLVIYRISRAPERRIFYIDVGNLPKMKAEQYVRDMMTKFKNKLVYDASSGEVRDDRKFMTMLEDFWLPRREGGRGTEITTLPGGQNLGEMDDVIYFQRKLFKSLSVPITRLEPETMYSLGRATEISRDEVKFSKFVSRLRIKFSQLFLKVLEKNLILKNIIAADEWPLFKQGIRFKYADDNTWAELKDLEIMRERHGVLRDVIDYVGTYYSHEYVQRHILRMTDEDIKQIQDQKLRERTDPEWQIDQSGGGMGGSLAADPDPTPATPTSASPQGSHTA
jgi:hypothetical protein